jgi:hypothetical protein
MKKLLAFAVGAAMSFGAFATPAPMLAPGPVYLKFNGIEQVAAGGATTSNYTGYEGEINWGVFIIDTMAKGAVEIPNTSITKSGPPYFVDSTHGQITGIFYGAKQGEVTAGNVFPATGGYLDLYWRDIDSGMTLTTLDGLSPSIRTDVNKATGFTEGTFLARLYFDTGMDPNSTTNTIVGDMQPTTAGGHGTAESYASVDTSAGGLWATQLDSNWFTSYLGQRDLRFKNTYFYNPSWGTGANGVFGETIDDPGQAFALPEPDALSLMGLAMAGMGVALRRRGKKAAK